jgi:hypothetical protein
VLSSAAKKGYIEFAKWALDHGCVD